MLLFFLSRLITVGERYISMVYNTLFMLFLVFLNVFCCSLVVYYRLRSQHTSLYNLTQNFDFKKHFILTKKKAKDCCLHDNYYIHF